MSAAAAESDPPLWQARELFELYRPKMKPRELTKDERAEVRALIKLHRESADAEWLAWYAERGETRKPRHQATLLRLIELGETGDEEAMIAARYAMAGAGTGLGWGVDAPFRMDVQNVRDDDYAEYLSYALVGHWTALIWQMHGPERSREARRGLSECLAQHYYTRHNNDVFSGRTWVVDCGFTVKISDAFKNGKDVRRSARHAVHYLATHYADKGGKPPFEIVSVEGFPSDDASQAALYSRWLSLWKPCGTQDPLGIQCGLTDGQRAWVQHYAQRNNRLGDLYGAEELARKKAELDRINAEYYARQGDFQARMACDKDFATLTTTNLQITDYAVASLEKNCAAAGDTYLEKFAQRFTAVDPANVDRLCNAGSSACARQRAAQNQRNADLAAQEKATRDAVKNAFTGKLPPASVNVRSYDQNGNYIGTESMTRGEAELRGAK